MEKFLSLITQNLFDGGTIAPEIMVVATFLMALIFDFTLTHKQRQSTGWLCIAGMVMALWLNLKNDCHFQQGQLLNQNAFSGMFFFDYFGSAFKSVLLMATIAALVIAIHARELHGRNHGEFYLLLLAVCMGGMFLCSASNLLMIYLSLESLSIVSYAMAGYLRRDRKSAEAGIKYVIYGAMASGIMIYGMSYLYGITGTLSLYHKDYNGTVTKGIIGVLSSWSDNEALKNTSPSGLVVVLAMIFSGFLYKIAAAPFHYWSPDVYEGSPTTAAGFFSVVPKAAGFAALIRVVVAIFPGGDHKVWHLDRDVFERVIAVISVLTMCIGNLAALGQTNTKRMLAYSSIAHAGYMLAGLTVLKTDAGPAASLFYLGVYFLMNLGAFLCLVAMENVFGGSDLRHLRGAMAREPVLTVALCVFLFSLTGLPPFAGFMGKWYIMVELVNSKSYGMVMWIGANSVVSLYYYMRIAKAAVIDAPVAGVEPTGKSPFAYNFLGVCKCLGLVLLFVYSEPVIDACRKALDTMGKL